MAAASSSDMETKETAESKKNKDPIDVDSIAKEPLKSATTKPGNTNSSTLNAGATQADSSESKETSKQEQNDGMKPGDKSSASTSQPSYNDGKKHNHFGKSNSFGKGNSFYNDKHKNGQARHPNSSTKGHYRAGQKRPPSYMHNAQKPPSKRPLLQGAQTNKESSQQQQRKPVGGETGSYRQYYRRRNDGSQSYGSQGSDENGDNRVPLIRKVVENLANINHTNPCILDIGCNNGTLTFQVARIPQVAQIIGVELDKALVKQARDTLRNFIFEASDAKKKVKKTIQAKKMESTKIALSSSSSSSTAATALSAESSVKQKEEESPPPTTNNTGEKHEETSSSKQMADGDAVSVTKTDEESIKSSTVPEKEDTVLKTEAGPSSNVLDSDKMFPFNTTFRIENIAMPDSQTSKEQKKYDIVLCLSVTKWIHIKHGDDGLERLFKSISSSLTDNGCLILEPQSPNSYKIAKQKGLCPRDFNLGKCRLKPNMFRQHLIQKYGFKHVEVLRDVKKGQPFNRQVLAFYKQKPPDAKTKKP